MKIHHINVFYSEEDSDCDADIPDLRACSAFGPTPESAGDEGEKGVERRGEGRLAGRSETALPAGRCITRWRNGGLMVNRSVWRQ